MTNTKTPRTKAAFAKHLGKQFTAEIFYELEQFSESLETELEGVSLLYDTQIAISRELSEKLNLANEQRESVLSMLRDIRTDYCEALETAIEMLPHQHGMADRISYQLRADGIRIQIAKIDHVIAKCQVKS